MLGLLYPTKQSLFYNIRKNQKLKKFQMFQKTQRETSAMVSRKVAGHFSDQLIYKTPPSDHFRPFGVFSFQWFCVRLLCGVRI